MARTLMKHQADQHRSERTFQVGDMDFLHLWPYKQSSLKIIGNQTLAPNISSPYTALQKIGYVAYKLALPPSSHIQQVIGTNIREQIVLPERNNEGSIISYPEAILNKHTCHIHSQSITEVLIQWHNMQPEDATWEPLLQIQKQFPHLKL